ncbi:unnamed protein product, partial [Protopolystoma xenopodis]
SRQQAGIQDSLEAAKLASERSRREVEAAKRALSDEQLRAARHLETARVNWGRIFICIHL